MSENEQKEPRVIVANPNRFKPAPEPEEKLSYYQRRVRKEREKKQQRLAQSAPYPSTRPSSIINAREAALNATSQLSENSALNREYPIADYKATLNITPSKSVPEGMNPFLSTPNELGLNRSEDVVSFDDYYTPSIEPVALEFDDYLKPTIDVEQKVDFDEFDINEQLPPNTKRIGGIKRRKSKKLRKSPKKSRKSRRKTTRKMRRHRRH